MKKLICVLLVLMMLAPSTVLAAPEGVEGAPVLPESENIPGGEELPPAAPEAQSPVLEIVGEVEVPEEPPAVFAAEPVISVTVPESSWVVVNPYGLEVARDGLVSTEQIVSPAMPIQNQSTVPVRVDARAVGTIPAGSEALFVSAPPAPETAAKEVFLFLEFQPFLGGNFWSGQFTDASNQLPVTEWGAEKQGLMTLEVGGQGELRLFGAAAPAPASHWTAADRVDVTIAFTFTAADHGGNF